MVSAWDEIHEVFGDGHDYDWALVDDEEAVYEEDRAKPEMKYQDVSVVMTCRMLCVLRQPIGLRTVGDSSTVTHGG